MDPNQVKQRTFLHQLANERKGLAQQAEEEKKGDFALSTVNTFREKMLREEKVSHSQERDVQPNHPNPAHGENPQKLGMVVPGGTQFFQKLKNTSEEEVKNKLRSNFRGLPIWSAIQRHKKWIR